MLVSVLILALLLAVLQVAVYVHVRNVVTASAQEGARYAANADVDRRPRRGADGGDRRAGDVRADRGGAACTSGEEPDATGLTAGRRPLLGSVPTLFAALGDLLPLT